MQEMVAHVENKDYAKIKKSRFIHADFVKGPRNNIFKQFLLDNGFLNIKKKNETGVYKMNILNKIKFLEIYEKNRKKNKEKFKNNI